MISKISSLSFAAGVWIQNSFKFRALMPISSAGPCFDLTEKRRTPAAKEREKRRFAGFE
jgi:hypothetical protein